MLFNLIRRSLKQSSSAAGGPNKALALPAVEALEARSLLDANAFVRSLYANILQRSSPTDAEVNGWVSAIDSGVSTQAVTQAFLGSSERFGVIVNNDYTSLLGRSVDPTGQNFFVQQMINGATQDQVEAQILGSQEYFNAHSQTNSAFLQGAYMDVLGRNAANADLQFWSTQFDNGASRTEVGLGILGSHEAHLRAVDMAYLDILHRNVDDMGGSGDYWANFLDSGHSESDLIAALTNSQEYLTETGMTPA
jgi:hypothetical protein